ncbi:MAG TPA: HD domain-containing protein [Candidatus Dormibacteraeota bacterium]|nr:HD domain-containing protein [Candidatus Dormibacteraeota bacterium]
MPNGPAHELAGVVAFLYEVGFLKRLPRAGWLMTGVDQPESVAEHSFRTALVGIILAAMEGADVGRTAMLCLLHDTTESRMGDIPSVGRAYVTTVKAEAISSHQTASMPAALASVVRDLVSEYEANTTIEARLAHDADKIETLLQAREYEAQGRYRTDAWVTSSVASLRTSAAKRLAEAANSGDPEGWWKPFAESYRELRQTLRGQLAHVQTARTTGAR